MASKDDVRAALERELEGYERMGDTERAEGVREALSGLGGRSRRARTEKAVTGPAEDAAERTGGVTTEDLGALGKRPARSRTRRKR